MQDDTQAPVEGKPDDAPTPPEEARSEASETPEQKPEYFSETFDPAALPDELRPAYKQMRDAFSQKTQTAAEERKQAREALEVYEALQDPDRQADILSRFGFEVDGADDDEFEYDDPQEALEQRIAALEAERQQHQQSAQEREYEEAEVGFVSNQLSELAKRTGREFSDEEIQLLGDLSRTDGFRDPDGAPNVDLAYERIYADVLSKERERWVGSKQSPQAPSGSSAVEVPDLDNERERQEYLAHKLDEIEASRPGN